MHESYIMRILHRWFNQKFLNIFFGYHSFAWASALIFSYLSSRFWKKAKETRCSSSKLISGHWIYLWISYMDFSYNSIIPTRFCLAFSSNIEANSWHSLVSRVCKMISQVLIIRRLLGTWFSMLLHLSSSPILTCRDSIFRLIYDTISRCFSRSFTLLPIL